VRIKVFSHALWHAVGFFYENVFRFYMHKDTVLFPPRHVFMDKNVGKNDKLHRHGDGGMDNKPGAYIPTTAHSSLIIRARVRERERHQ
jgi:hypothetical protein